MGRLVQVSDSSALQVQLPNGHNYTYGNYVVLSNEEFAVINPASYGTDAILTDRGAFPLVNPVPTGPPVPSLGALDLLNSDTVQVGNALAPARTNLGRYEELTDVAIVPATEQVVFVPVLLLDGDVVTNVVYRTGATAAGTPTHQFAALYSPAGALLHQSTDSTSTARAANTTVTLALSATYTVPAGGGGVFYVGLGFTAATPPSVLSRVLGADTGIVPQFAALTSAGTSVYLARKTVGGTYTTTAPSTIAGATGLTTAANAPYVILT
jgi:hypothetical protein